MSLVIYGLGGVHKHTHRNKHKYTRIHARLKVISCLKTKLRCLYVAMCSLVIRKVDELGHLQCLNLANNYLQVHSIHTAPGCLALLQVSCLHYLRN